MTTRWEYWTGILDASIQRKTKDTTTISAARYSPQHLIPQLNALGDEGWELVHMEPVYTGSNEDILMHDTMRNWTSAYFCVLKRPREF
ncbi:MAG: hypothetical protein JXN59_13590 [Anaerolineae bacterium]|nr:hypothetical protein [Anaerolineae bacterium]